MTHKEQVAELMSQDRTPVEIQQIMGISKSAFYNALRRIRKDLGWQAQ